MLFVVFVELVYYVRPELDVDVRPTERTRLDFEAMGSSSADLVGSLSRSPGTSVVRSSFSHVFVPIEEYWKLKK